MLDEIFRQVTLQRQGSKYSTFDSFCRSFILSHSGFNASENIHIYLSIAIYSSPCSPHERLELTEITFDPNVDWRNWITYDRGKKEYRGHEHGRAKAIDKPIWV